MASERSPARPTDIFQFPRQAQIGEDGEDETESQGSSSAPLLGAKGLVIGAGSDGPTWGLQ